MLRYPKFLNQLKPTTAMKQTYLKVVILIFVFVFGTIATAQSQHNHLSSKKIKISNPSMETLNRVKNLGIDLSCGANFTETDLFLELAGEEVELLENSQISFTVEIENLSKAISERNAQELPGAILELEQRKIRERQEDNLQRSVSTYSTDVSNIVQYEGANEIDWKTPENFQLGSMGGCFTYEGMLDELDKMRALYPHLISAKKDASLAEDGSGTPIVTNGNSYTGPTGTEYNTFPPQTIYYARIGADPTNPSFDPNEDQPNKPESFYSGMSHSREVSSMMNLIFYMWYILENYETDPSIKSLVDNHEMYFVPVANPDGLMWNEQIDPNGGGLQRKNLRVNPGQNLNSDLRGVDPNRNYDYFWGDFPQYPGSSSTFDSNVYRGPSAFSEPETRITERFVENHNVKTALNHHATSNLLPHAYNGFPNAAPSGREDEYSTFCNQMTRFNRYMYGEAPDVLTVANGDMSDWMLGGSQDLNMSTGSGKGILAMAPENGSSNEGSTVGAGNGFSGFWPTPANIVNIAKRAVRMNLVSARFAGKLARVHDFTPIAITNTTSSLDFGLEYLGQTLGDIDLSIVPISDNISSISPIATQTGWSKLEQRQVSSSIVLNPSIAAGEEIQYEITLSSGDYILHKVIIRKVYNPNTVFQDNPDVDGVSNWTTTGSWGVDSQGFDGTLGIGDSPNGNSYNNSQNNSITLNTNQDISAFAKAVITFNATWDIERSFDYVQLQGSSDNGATWIPMSGKYTKPGATLDTTPYNSSSSSHNGGTTANKSNADRGNQPDGQPIWEGYKLDKWVMEEVVIDQNENSQLFQTNNLRLRFVFNSDSSNRSDGYSTTFDGFTFDDLTITGVNLTDACRETITSTDLPYSEGLNADIGLWTQVSGDDGDWTIDGDGTASGGTGPAAPFEGSDYLYLEATDPSNGDPNAIGFPNKKGVLNSPCFDLTGFSNAEFTFRYHMYSTDADPGMGDIDLEVSIDEGLTWINALNISGNQGDVWNLATVDLSAYTDNIARLRFTGTTGTTFRSDIAIDDIKMIASTTTYIYDAGAWTPQDPSGIATSNDNIEVRSGAPTLSANTIVNNVTILAGATLNLAATTLGVNGNITNSGAISGGSGTLLMKGSAPQEITGSDFEIANLVIDNSDTTQGVTLSTAVSVNKLLTLTDGTLNTGNTLTLLSNASRTAMIDVITGGTISGNVTTERYIPARRAFRLISSPVTTTTSINANWQEGVNNTGTSFPADNMNPNPGYGTHISGSLTGANGFDATASGNGSIFKLDNASQSWQDVVNTDVNTLTAGDPMRLLVRGDRSINVTSNAATPTATTLRATGTIATSPVSVTGATLNHTAGAFNFIGNPYQASLNMNTVLSASTNLRTGEIWVWDATLGSRGQYVTVLLDGSGSSNGANSKDYHYLQPGQAIFTATNATVTDSSTEIVFNETDKVVGNEVPLYSNTSNAIATSPHLIGRLYRSEHYGEEIGLQDNFVILYSDDYSNDVTSEDVSKFFNIDENMGVLKDGGLLSIDKVAMPTEDDQIQLYNALYRTSDYTLDLDIYGLDEVETFLKDNHTGDTTLLEEGLNTISFAVDNEVESSVDTKRFEIVYQREVLSTIN